MHNDSSPRKAINEIITNIRQIASNISKDVSMKPQITFVPQPTQEQHYQQKPQNSNYMQDAIEARAATSSRANLDFEDNDNIQKPCDIAQGIKNAHSKVDQALRFMNDMKNRLEPEVSAKTSAKGTPYDRKCFSVNALPDGNKEDITAKNAQLLYPKSLPVLSQHQETPSLTSLPMTLEDVSTSPKNGVPTYFNQYDPSLFNPFTKPSINSMSEVLNMLEQKNSVPSAAGTNFSYSISALPSANSRQSVAQMVQSQIGSVPRKVQPATTYLAANNLNTAGNVDLQRKLLSVGLASLPSSVNTLQSRCDHNRLNQIIHNIKQKGAGQQAQVPQHPLSLNEMHLGSIHSLTSLHDQAAEFETIRPNTVSHFSRQLQSSKGISFPRENNFYQLPAQPKYEAVPSHFSSQHSVYGGTIGLRPNAAASGFLEAVQKATNQLSEVEPLEHTEEEEEEFCKPRRLRFEDQPVNPQTVHSRKNVSHAQERKKTKQRKPEAVQKQKKSAKSPTCTHKAHKTRDVQEAFEKPNRCRNHANEDDSEVMDDESVIVTYHVCHSRRPREPVCHHENCASGQSEEESMEESVGHEIHHCCGKAHTQRAEAKASVCQNCNCKKVGKQYMIYTTSTNSGRISGSRRRSHSRRQKSSIEDPRVVFDESINTHETEAYESRAQTLRRNKSIDCNKVRNSMGRRGLIDQRVINHEPTPSGENWALPKSRKNSKQQGKISLESLRKKDENQEDYRRYQDRKSTKLSSELQDSQSQLYSKVFVDQLALEFPSTKENKFREDSVSKNKVVQKTEIIRTGNARPKRILF